MMCRVFFSRLKIRCLRRITRGGIKVRSNQFMMIITSNNVNTNIIIVSVTISSTTNVNRLQTNNFRFIRYIHRTSIRPRVNLQDRRMYLLRISEHQEITHILLMSMITSNINGRPRNVIFHQKRRPQVTMKHVRRSQQNVRGNAKRFLFRHVMSSQGVHRCLFTLHTFPSSLQGHRRPFNFTRQEFFRVVTSVRRQSTRLLRFTLRHANPIRTRGRRGIEIRQRRGFVVSVSLMARITSTITTYLGIKVKSVIRSQGTSRAYHLTSNIRRNSVNQKRHRSTLHVPFRSLPIRALKGKFPIAKSRRPNNSTVHTLPQVRSKGRRTLSTIYSFGLRSQNVFKDMGLFIRVNGLKALTAATYGYRHGRRRRTRVLWCFRVVALFAFALFSTFPRFQNSTSRRLRISTKREAQRRQRVILIRRIVSNGFRLCVRQFRQRRFLR